MNPSIAGAFQSKTMRASALTIAVGVIQYVQPFIPPQYVPLALIVSGALGTYLRTLTNQSLADKATS